MRDKITVLFLASDPFRERAALRLDEEVRAIDRAVRKGRARGRVELVAHFGTHTRDLQDALLRHDPQVVHFAGNGDDPCVLYLGDEHGRPRPVGTDALGTLFGMLGEWIKVVVINGRDTLPTVEALGEGVDYAIGMDRPLGDPSAIVFAGAFYGALAMGRTVREAFELAVSRMEHERDAASTTPVLRIRPGVDPDVPLVARPADTSTPAPASGGGGGGAQPAGAGRVSTWKTFDGDGVVIETRPGPKGDGGKVKRLGGDTAARRLARRNGRSR
jgi:hypothetical protein